jgi:hypothetical protein
MKLPTIAGVPVFLATGTAIYFALGIGLIVSALQKSAAGFNSPTAIPVVLGVLFVAAVVGVFLRRNWGRRLAYLPSVVLVMSFMTGVFWIPAMTLGGIMIFLLTLHRGVFVQASPPLAVVKEE